MLKRKVDLCEANSWNRCETEYFPAHSCLALSGREMKEQVHPASGFGCFQNSHDRAQAFSCYTLPFLHN